MKTDPSLCDLVVKSDASVSLRKTLLAAHLKNLETEFSNLFENLPSQELPWVLNPFAKNLKMQHLSVSLQAQLADTGEDGHLPAQCQENPLPKQ